MAISPMSKIRITGTLDLKDRAVGVLHDFGGVEITSGAIPEAKADNVLNLALADILFAISFLEKFSKAKEKRNITEIFSPKKEIAGKNFEKIGESFDYQDIIEKAKAIEEGITNAKNEINFLNEKKRTLLPWEGFQFPLNIFQDSKKVFIKFLFAKDVDLDKFCDMLAEQKIPFYVSLVSKSGADAYFTLTADVEHSKVVSELLNAYSVSVTGLELSKKTPKESISEIESLINQKSAELESLKKEAEALSGGIENLKICHDFLNFKKQKILASQKGDETKRVFSIEGWVETEKLNFLKKSLKEISELILIEKVEAEEKEYPIILRNSSLVEPFEAVTNVYGMPKSSEPDPTPYLAGFFLIFFSLALTDAGYGIVLASLSFVLMKFFKLPKDMMIMIKLMFFGGIATFIAGAVTGGWFGVDLTKLPAPLSSALNSVILFEPIEEPLVMMAVALACGIVQILFGICIRMARKIKAKGLAAGFLDDLPWLYFILSVLLYGLNSAGMLQFLSKNVLIYSVFAGMALIVLTQGRKYKNIFAKVGMGVLSLYDFVGYFSDALSYSRLLALGLATSVIAMVVNIIGALILQIPYVGWLLMAVFLVLGHLFNIAINVLGAFIHSSRLQFVEFFPKFMEGGGKIFNPFKKESKFIIIK